MKIREEDLKYIIENFKHEKNKVLANKMGISTSTISKMAIKHGLKKTREHLIETKRAAAAIAHIATLRTIAKERMRINWGLEQKTKMKLVRNPHKQASYRYLLKKYGYIVDKGSKDLYYPGEEMRNKKMEKYAETTHKMRFYSIEEKHR